MTTNNAPPKLCDFLDNSIIRFCHAVAWLNAILLVLIAVQVILRYAFSKGLVIFDELEWHFYAVNVMLGLSYAMAKDSHIRLDVVSNGFMPRTKEKIEIFGIVFFVIPLVAVVGMHGWDFWYSSWKVNEHSLAPMGLCCRWIIKAFIPIGFGLLGVSALSRLIRAIAFLTKKGA